jgi:hypothetical protein
VITCTEVEENMHTLADKDDKQIWHKQKSVHVSLNFKSNGREQDRCMQIRYDAGMTERLL